MNRNNSERVNYKAICEKYEETLFQEGVNGFRLSNMVDELKEVMAEHRICSIVFYDIGKRNGFLDIYNYAGSKLLSYNLNKKIDEHVKKYGFRYYKDEFIKIDVKNMSVIIKINDYYK